MQIFSENCPKILPKNPNFCKQNFQIAADKKFKFLLKKITNFSKEIYKFLVKNVQNFCQKNQKQKKSKFKKTKFTF